MAKLQKADLVFNQVRHESGDHYVFAIECGGCGVTASLGRFNFGPRIAAEQLPQKASRLGWRVGKRKQDHRCPSCVAKEQEAKRAKLHVIEAKETSMLKEVPKADPPRQMQRSDKRIIVSKLEEHYIDERSGYDKGWNDERVAKDLGIPRAWVSEVREDMFGPEKVIDHAVISRAHADELSAKAKAVDADLKRISEAIKSVEYHMASLQASARELVAKMGG